MKLWLLLLSGLGLLVGCAPTLVPHTPYIPLTQKQGQAEARVATGVGGSELQLGYQVTDRLVLHTGLLSYGRPSRAKGFRSADLGLGYYYPSPNGVWRLGIHVGGATGSGTSGSPTCFECSGTGLGSEYAVRYTYAYVQPTIILLGDGRRSWAVGLRLGQAYYQHLNETITDNITGQTQLIRYAGHTSTFVQPTFQSTYQVCPWLMLSSKFGVQGFLGSNRLLNEMGPFVAQGSVHYVLSKRSESQP